VRETVGDKKIDFAAKEAAFYFLTFAHNQKFPIGGLYLDSNLESI
jgi:hypothetical protein